MDRIVGARVARGARGRAELAHDFREAFAAHPSGVAVITAAGPRGPVGLTASSVISVAVAPPVLAFSLSSSRGSVGALLASSQVAVHLLTAADEELARRFSAAGVDRFGPGSEWRAAPTGEPLLATRGTILRCRVLSRTPVAGSTLVAAQVTDIPAPGPTAEPRQVPLVHYLRGYHRLAGDD